MKKQMNNFISRLALVSCWVMVLALVINQQSVRGLAQEAASQAGTANGQENAAALQRARIEQRLDALLAKAKEGRRVSVIVGIRGDFKPESELPNKQAAALQRQRIRGAQTALLEKMTGFVPGSVKQFRSLPYLVFDVDESGLQALRQMDEITSVVEDGEAKPQLDQSVPLINVPQSWAAGFSGQGQTVAILDTGFDLNHPFLGNRIVAQACFSTTNSTSTSVCPNGQNSMIGGNAARSVASNVFGFDHGTHVAGIAAGNGATGGVSFSGVAKDANIIAIQVFRRKTGESCTNFGVSSPCLLTAFSDQIAALEHVLDLSDDIDIAAVNLSLGGSVFTQSCNDEIPAYTEAIRNLRNQRIATVIAAGNNGSDDSLSFPACISTAVSVGATTLQDQVASFSNSNRFLDLWAPGAGTTDLTGIRSSIPNDTFARFRGTSMAAPHVTGAFAVLKSKVPSLTVPEMQSLLTATGVAITDPRNDITKRRIDVGAASSTLCAAQVSPAAFGLTRFGGTVPIQVIGTSDACPWTVRSNVPWIVTINPQPVSGNGTAILFIFPNPTNSVRQGTVTIGGRTVTIVQVN